MLPAQSFLAQAAVTDVGAQAVRFLELLLTPVGFIGGIAAFATVLVLLASKRGSVLLGAFTIFLLSMMRSESRFADNTLVQPLETLRGMSRPVALALFVVLAARMLLVGRGNRRMLVVAPAAMLLAYEAYYLAMIGVFVDPARAALGMLSVVSVAVAMCLGFGKLLEPEEDPAAMMKMFGIAGVGFIAANAFQLALGYSNAILGGRLAGVSGNAQQLAATCCAFMVVACYFFVANRGGSPIRWLSAASIGVLGLFVLWSGSRTGAVCTALVLVTFFRAKVGRLLVVLVIAAAVVLVATSFIQESTFGAERFLYGADTRTKAWGVAIDEFVRSPLFGSIPYSADEPMNLSESTYLRTLALMGITGGALLFLVVASMIWTAIRVWIASRRNTALTPFADVVVSATAYMVVVNAAEGLMLGILTIFVVFLYGMFATAAYVLDTAAQDQEPQQAPQSDFGD